MLTKTQIRVLTSLIGTNKEGGFDIVPSGISVFTKGSKEHAFCVELENADLVKIRQHPHIADAIEVSAAWAQFKAHKSN